MKVTIKEPKVYIYGLHRYISKFVSGLPLSCIGSKIYFVPLYLYRTFSKSFFRQLDSFCALTTVTVARQFMTISVTSVLIETFVN